MCIFFQLTSHVRSCSNLSSSILLSWGPEFNFFFFWPCHAVFCWALGSEVLLQKGGPLPGIESGLLSKNQKWIVWGVTHAAKPTDFIGKGHPGGEKEAKGTQEDCSAKWLTVSGFMVMGLVSRLCLSNHSDSGSFLVEHTLLSQDGCQWEFWDLVGHKSLGLQGDQISQPWRKSFLNIHWKDWCWSSDTLATWCEELTTEKDPDSGKDLRQKEKGMTEVEIFR